MDRWLVDEKLRWCWLELGGAALMLQTSKTAAMLPSESSAEGSRSHFSAKTPGKLYGDLFRALIPGIFPVRSAVSMRPRQRAKRFQ